MGKLIPPLSYMIPLLIVMGTLRRRSLYPVRAIGSVCPVLRHLQGAAWPAANFRAAWDSPASISMLLLVYLAVLLMMVVVVLACCNVSFMHAFFYAGPHTPSRTCRLSPASSSTRRCALRSYGDERTGLNLVCRLQPSRWVPPCSTCCLFVGSAGRASTS